MWADRLRAALRRDDGFAMMTAMVVSSVMMIFTMGMLATGLHLTDQTIRDKSWNTALQVAEAALDHAVYEIGLDPTFAGTGAGVLPLPDGEAEILVDYPAAGSVVVYATGWVPSRTAVNAVRRRIEVTFAPQDVFNYALFSETGLFVKNNGVIIGDVFANEGVEVDQNADIYGNVISATDGVKVGNSAIIHATNGEGGSVYSGGPAGIEIGMTAEVQGSAYAQATSCAGTPAPGEYGIVANNNIAGEAIAWGTITGHSGGTPSNCQLARAVNTLPSFTWDPSLYTGEVEYATVQAFQQTYVDVSGANMSGVHYVWDDACATDPSGSTAIELGNTTVSDDFTLVTNCRIGMTHDFTVSADDNALIDIIVLNPSANPAAIEIKNNFDVLNDPAVLLYSTGLMTVKNNPNHNGAVYAGAISIKNNLDVTYDARVERTLGFGDLKYDRVSWIECRVGTTGTDC